VSSWGAKRRRI